MKEHMKFYAFEQVETKRKTRPSGMSNLKRFVYYNLDGKSLCFAVISLLLGGASFMESVFPWGVGWLGALAVWDKRRLPVQIFPVLAGVFLWTSTPAVYAVILLLLAVFFSIYSPGQERVKYLLPLTVFSVTLAVRGIYLVFSGISDLLLIVTFVESILGAGLSLVFLSTLETWQRFTFMEKPSWEEILCNFLVATGVIMGLEHIVIFGMPLSEIAMRLVVLLGALIGGAGGGAAAGSIMGVIPSLAGTTSPSALGLFAFSGLLGGVFQRFGKFGVIVGFLTGNLILTFYLLNTELIMNSVIASLIAAALLFSIPDKLLFRGKEILSTGKVVLPAPKSYSADSYVNTRLKAAGSALEYLRNALGEAYKKEGDPKEKNIEAVLSHISRTVCNDCGLKEICWQSDFYATYKDILTMFAAVEAKGVVGSKDIPDGLKKRCSRRKEIAASVNCLYEMYKKNDFWRQQTMSSRSLALSQLDNTVHLLTKIQENFDDYVEFRQVLDTKLSGALRNNDFFVDYINVISVETNHVDLDLKIRDCGGNGRCGRVVSGCIEGLTGKRFRLQEFECAKERGQLCHCRFFVQGGLGITSHSIQKPKDKQSVSGDCCCDFILADAKRCFVISDGMGSGPEARKEAEEVSSLVQRILVSGFDQGFAAAMMNYIILANSDKESFATADIGLMDPYKRKAQFVKLGAAPSYICTPGAGVKVISGNSLPLGSESFQEPEVYTETIGSGDILVMVS
ncbi:MAG: SpoIIE family protein phosphatase, partial [Bacillota bacterium]|nr:SpoIIE family protein phosphatase [Bacillota bacterium]